MKRTKTTVFLSTLVICLAFALPAFGASVTIWADQFRVAEGASAASVAHNNFLTSSPGGALTLYAPLALPAGRTIQRMKFFFVNGDNSGFITVSLNRYRRGAVAVQTILSLTDGGLATIGNESMTAQFTGDAVVRPNSRYEIKVQLNNGFVGLRYVTIEYL